MMTDGGLTAQIAEVRQSLNGNGVMSFNPFIIHRELGDLEDIFSEFAGCVETASTSLMKMTGALVSSSITEEQIAAKAQELLQSVEDNGKSLEVTLSSTFLAVTKTPALALWDLEKRERETNTWPSELVEVAMHGLKELKLFARAMPLVCRSVSEIAGPANELA